MDRATEMLVFAKVVESESFSAAARNLRLTPSAVSRQVARLEERLGVRLLNRTTRQLSVTDEGMLFFQRCQRILADIDDAEQEITQGLGTPRGVLHLTTSIAFGRHEIVPLIPEFLSRHPEMQIELHVSDSYVDLVEEGLDLAIRIGRLPDSALVARKLASAGRVIVAAPRYLQRHGTPHTAEDLLAHNCLTVSQQSRLNEWDVEGPEGPITARVSGNFVANTSDALHQAAVAGLGLVRVSSYVVIDDIQQGRLVRVLPQFTQDEAPIYAVYPHRRLVSPKVRAFVDFLLERYNPEPPWANCSAA